MSGDGLNAYVAEGVQVVSGEVSGSPVMGLVRVEVQVVIDPLYKPPLFPADPTRKFWILLCVVTVACAFSTDAPNQTLLLKLLTTRNPYCRAHVKPTE